MLEQYRHRHKSDLLGKTSLGSSSRALDTSIFVDTTSSKYKAKLWQGKDTGSVMTPRKSIGM